MWNMDICFFGEGGRGVFSIYLFSFYNGIFIFRWGNGFYFIFNFRGCSGIVLIFWVCVLDVFNLGFFRN